MGLNRKGEREMVRKALLLAVGVTFLNAAAAVAADPFMGTWKLNEAKSKFSPGAPKNTTVIYEAAGDQVKVTVDGVDGKGQPLHHVWTGKFDGKDYAVTGDPMEDMRSYKKVNEHTLTVEQKKGGKVMTTGRVVVAADGKSRTVTTSGTNAEGQKITWTAVYDKQ
jgi:hypothetical protein